MQKKLNTRKIAILGGSFNPPHIGHKAIAENIIASNQCEKLIILPSYQNPLKQNHPRLACQAQLIAATFRGLKSCIIDWYSYYQPKISYSIKDLSRLKLVYGVGFDFFLYLGSDTWSQFYNWQDYRAIKKMVQIIIVPRKGWTFDLQFDSKDISLVKWDIPKISSTELYHRLDDKNFVKKYLTAEAYAAFVRSV